MSKLLENYLVDLNSYPRFKKNKVRKAMDSKLIYFAAISMALLFIKMAGESFNWGIK